jgi:hypothetical protein
MAVSKTVGGDGVPIQQKVEIKAAADRCILNRL